MPIGRTTPRGSSNRNELSHFSRIFCVIPRYHLAMATYALAQLKMKDIAEFCEIEDSGVLPHLWDDRKIVPLSDEEIAFIVVLRRWLTAYKTHLVNEATIWARAIYPLLALAERDNIRAFSAVPLSATFPWGELRGEVDGALAHMDIEASAAAPYFVVVEAKRGVEGHDAIAQLLGGILCAASRNHKHDNRDEHVLYGVYTIADVWTFIQVKISGLDSARPRIKTAFSREYMEKTEAFIILQLMKSMLIELAGS